MVAACLLTLQTDKPAWLITVDRSNSLCDQAIHMHPLFTSVLKRLHKMQGEDPEMSVETHG